MPCPITFQELQNQATCGRRIQRLAHLLALHHPSDMDGPLGDLDAHDYRTLGDLVRGIEAVLDLLATTPNTHLNREALDALAVPVRQAKGLLEQDWIGELLAKDAQRVEPGEIPW